MEISHKSRNLSDNCHDISDAGLACFLVESAFAGDAGIDVDLRTFPVQAYSRTISSSSPNQPADLWQQFAKRIGKNFRSYLNQFRMG